MARTQIHPLVLVVNGFETDSADSTVLTAGVGNGVFVAASEADAEVLVLRLTNSGGATANVSVKAGQFPLAPSSGQGDLVVPVPAGGTVFAGPFESARFAQADGSTAIDSDAAVAVTAIKASRH
jgi:hypothetical protein